MPPVSEMESPKLKIAGKSQSLEEEADVGLENVRSRMLKQKAVTNPMLKAQRNEKDWFMETENHFLGLYRGKKLKRTKL